MRPGDARRWLSANFGTTRRTEAHSKTVSEVDLSSALEHLAYLKQCGDFDHSTIERFLWEGCRRFDRWYPPSPPSVPITYQKAFSKFSAELSAHERVVMNAPPYQVHALRDELYRLFADKSFPLSDAEQAQLSELYERLGSITAPDHPFKLADFQTVKRDVLLIIRALQAGTIRTLLQTSIPYPIIKQPLEITIRWRGHPVSVALVPSFTKPECVMFDTPPPMVIRPLTITRWQHGITNVTLDISALIDPSMATPPLQLPAVGQPIDTWPNGLRVAFDIVYAICWSLRERPEYIGLWVPAPGDLGTITSTIVVPDGKPDFSLIKRDNPSMSSEVFRPSPEVVKFDLGEAKELSWHKRCRVLANQYAVMGETREAIFWLNVGVEYLLRSRMEKHIKQHGLRIDLDVLDGAATYWDEAKELVGKTFPELVEEIPWPSGGRKPSLFQQLKYFCHNVPHPPELGLVKSHYGKVSKNRNMLFHGNHAETIPTGEVQEALTNFDCLDEHFCQG